jgi:hypothetical protein
MWCGAVCEYAYAMPFPITHTLSHTHTASPRKTALLRVSTKSSRRTWTGFRPSAGWWTGVCVCVCVCTVRDLYLFTTPHYTTLHYTTLHHTALHYTIQHYTTLHCTTLYYTTLHYTILHYQTPTHAHTHPRDFTTGDIKLMASLMSFLKLGRGEEVMTEGEPATFWTLGV